MSHTNPIVIPDDLLSAVTCGLEGQRECSELVVSRLNIVSQWLTNVEAVTASLTSTIMSEFEEIFTSLDLGSHDSTVAPLSAVASPTQWLLDNLHNPYPSNTVKRSMRGSHELAGRTVNEWFTRARQRIGWTRLLRDRFGGCRSAATDAAFRAFVRDDPHSPLDVELYAAFMAVKAHASLVYSPSSPVALSPQSLSSRSPPTSPTSVYPIGSEDSGDNTPRSSQKRKQSYSETLAESSTISPPTNKRRLESSPKLIPSISSSSYLPATPAEGSITHSPPRSRKRRLSETNSTESAAKKPRASDWAPRKQTVSDPLPLSATSFDSGSLCTEAFAFPPVATTSHPVPDALDFELFNFEAFPASLTTDIVNSSDDTSTGLAEHSGGWLDSIFGASGQTEQGSLPTLWEDFFNFGLPCHLSTLPSLTNSPSPSTPDTQWSLSPPELPDFESLEPPLFDFPSPSTFKIPALYPAEGVDIIKSGVLIS